MNPIEASFGTENTQENILCELDPQSLVVGAPFVGQWNQLISQTNWEKGRIIFEWRHALVESGAPSTSYSDEAWAQCVGSVTGQHVGRLRRVHERFSACQSSYPGLFWSHFLAAIDWDDAELWLEGAARSSWSVSEMRRTRSEATSAAGKEPEREEELIASELDDGFVALASDEEAEGPPFDGDGSSGPLDEGPDFGDENTFSEGDPGRIEAADSPNMGDEYLEGTEMLRENPFASLGELPPDVAESLEQFKLTIIRHRSSSWMDISHTKMLQVIDSLRTFAQVS